MAKELTLTYSGTGAALYVVIRRKSDGYAWNGAAFEAWSDANVGTYDIALTDAGGDLYYADFPAGIASGDYRIVYYIRAGASPATTDEPLKTQVRHWDGSALTQDESEITLSAYALTTLETVKRRLEIDDTDSDTVLTEIINQVSAQIEAITGRQFKARDRRDWLNGANQREIRLPHFPVQHVSRIAFGVANALSVTFAAGSNIRATAGVFRDPESPDGGGLRLQTVNASGVVTTNSLTFADYPSVSTLAAGVNLIGGWTATVLSNQPSADLHASGGGSALGQAVTFTYPGLAEYQYAIDYERGLVRFDRNASAWWGWTGAGTGGYASSAVTNDMAYLDTGWRMPRQFQGVLAQYRAGYETIPQDVAMVCAMMVQDIYYTASIGQGVTEVRLGPGVLKLSDSQEDDVRSDLRRYIDDSAFIGGVR
jgi:hypothetical protein